jgi:hypothetical protein
MLGCSGPYQAVVALLPLGNAMMVAVMVLSRPLADFPTFSFAVLKGT